jgi:hypothetical protein
MPYIIVENFKGGLDTRRSILNSAPGTLTKFVNAHVNRGGEIEKRKAFVQIEGGQFNWTYGFESTNEYIYIFGAGQHTENDYSNSFIKKMSIGYNPPNDPYLEFDEVIYSTVFSGKVFALIKGNDWNFNLATTPTIYSAIYDGSYIEDFTNGMFIGNGRDTNSAMVLHFERIIQLEIDKYIAEFNSDTTVSGEPLKDYTVSHEFGATWSDPSKVIITGPKGNIDFGFKSYVSPADDPAGTPIVTSEVTQEATKTVDKVLPKASFKITGGKNGAARVRAGGRYGFGTMPYISGIYIADSHTDTSGLEISGLTSPVPPKDYYPYDDEGDTYNGSEAQHFHHNLCRIINANSSVSNFTAVEERDRRNWSGPDPVTSTIYSNYKEGTFFNGKRVLIEFVDGLNNLGDSLSGLYDSPFNAGRKVSYFGGPFVEGDNNAVTSILIDRQKALNESVYWETSHDQLAADIVTAFNLGPLSTEYIATRDGGDGEQIFISPIDTDDPESYNNKTLSVITDGAVIASSFKSFNGGRNMILGKEKIVEFTFSNISSNAPQSFGSEIWIMITDPSNPDVPYKFGSTRITSKETSFCFTYKSKMYVASGSTVYFSALNDPTKWDIYDTGSGFIDMSNNFGGRETITGMGVFQGYVAVFTKTNAQLWYFDPDPTKNSQHQIVDNTGCVSPGSVCSIGSLDLLFLAPNGIRSLRTRQVTDSPYANDIGSPIDEIIIGILNTMTDEEKFNCKSIVDPIDGRYWLLIKGRLFVLSSFYGSSINAWSEYEIPAGIKDMVLFNNKIFLMSTGGSIYVYGGLDGNTYDDCKVTVEMPYLDANKPATIKSFQGLDVNVTNQWSIYMGFDHTANDQKDLIATVNQPTFALGKIMVSGVGTHVGIKMECEQQGPAEIANLIVHFDELYSKHEAG